VQQKLICSKCGAENNSNTQFCLYCGAIMQDNCPNCGSMVNPASKFCSTCGAGLGWGNRIKDLQQQVFQTENTLMSSLNQYSKDMRNDFTATTDDLKATLSSYGNEFLAQQNLLNSTSGQIQKLVQAAQRMTTSVTLTKIGMGLIGLGLAVLILSYIMPDITMLALSGIGIALLGFILQLISIFFTGR
jgi:hypothetical protein